MTLILIRSGILQCYNSPLFESAISAYKKNIFIISQPKHMLWVLKSTVF